MTFHILRSNCMVRIVDVVSRTIFTSVCFTSVCFIPITSSNNDLDHIISGHFNPIPCQRTVESTREAKSGETMLYSTYSNTHETYFRRNGTFLVVVRSCNTYVAFSQFYQTLTCIETLQAH